jgi:hypothetical protein
MRRAALFVLTLHLAAGPVLAQTLWSSTPPADLTPTAGGMQTPDMKPAVETTQPPPAPLVESLVNFDPQRVDVLWSENHWQVVADGKVLKDFGRREIEARLAVRLMRDLHLNQHGVVGSPQPVMEYWLSDGRAPYGLAMGLHLIPIDVPNLRVEERQGQWGIRDNNHVLFGFGAHEGDARDALAIIHKYNFTQIGFIGDAGPSMLIMLGHGNVDISDSGMPHLPPHSPLRAPAPNDPFAASVQQKFAASGMQQSKGANDMTGMSSPLIPPLRTPPPPSTTTVNAFGKTETVEVLPPETNSAIRPHRLEPLPPTAQELIDHTEFSWRLVQVRSEGGRYVVAAGSLVLGSFKNDHDARIAQAAIQHYHFTEVNHIGRPQPFTTFYLSNGVAPLGDWLGVHGETFRPDRLSVAQIDNRWAIVSSDQPNLLVIQAGHLQEDSHPSSTPMQKPLLWFGTRVEEANVMLDVIQRQQFDRICHVGDDHGLTFFVRSH